MRTELFQDRPEKGYIIESTNVGIHQMLTQSNVTCVCHGLGICTLTNPSVYIDYITHIIILHHCYGHSKPMMDTV